MQKGRFLNYLGHLRGKDKNLEITLEMANLTQPLGSALSLIYQSFQILVADKKWVIKVASGLAPTAVK
jgi:hypothetical protein